MVKIAKRQGEPKTSNLQGGYAPHALGAKFIRPAAVHSRSRLFWFYVAQIYAASRTLQLTADASGSTF
ncbi:hypothetical protein [uncultured Campylobacter sp.]|uniref:hypothetical protein n=1 Tax=uncultured Campylobacter sp. TaxID=218934 RepID=UPI00263006D8|nr:hypothetical protein [uncultured Campylobacter sp.]